MKMRVALFCLSMMLSSVLQAQSLLRTLFKEMPDSIVPYLSKNNRLDMLDFWDSNMKMDVRNQLDGRSQLTSLNDTYLQLHLNDVSELELVVLDMVQPVDSASQIVCLIHTLGGDIKESTVRFYSVKWKPLPAERYISLPQEMFVADWLESQSILAVTQKNFMDMPAEEGQKRAEEVQINFKWSNDRFNKY